MNNQVTHRIKSHIKSMIEISFEYTGWNKEEVDHIFIFCSTEESLFFTVFYSINGILTERHRINEFLKKKCNTSELQQFAVDKIGLDNLEMIVSCFKTNSLEIPTVLKITYIPLSKEFNFEFDYQANLTGNDLIEEDLVEMWMKSLK